MIDTKLISLLRCPIDGNQLELADSSMIERVNLAISRGEVRDRGDQKLTTSLEGGLVAGGGTRMYPIRSKIPSLIAAEAIELTEWSETSD